MGYLAPDAPISDSWQGHKNRNPPSAEPGTDYALAYGSPVPAADPGVVVDLKTSNSGGTGRYLTINLDDGRRIRYLHLSEIWLSVGTRVGRGTHIGKSGASGNGNDWYYGPHVHVSLWARPGLAIADTIDFALYVGDPPPPPPPPNLPEGEAIMYIQALNDGQYARKGTTYTNDIGGHWRGVSNLEGDGYIIPLAGEQLPFAKFNGKDIDLLFAVNGYWEQDELDGHIKWSSGKGLIGPGALTGRLMYPGTEGKRGKWHNPYRTVPIWLIIVLATFVPAVAVAGSAIVASMTG